MSSSTITARDAGAMFEETAELLELQGENQFRVRAYETAARLLLSQTMSIAMLLEEVKSGNIRGIGAGLQEAIREIAETGSSSLLTELRESFPAGVRQLLRLPGLGPKKLKLLYSELGIDSIETLIAACDAGRLVDVRGFSEKTQSGLKEAASRFFENREKMLLPQGVSRVNEFMTLLLEQGSARAWPAGEVRRALPVIESLEIVAETNEPENLASKTADMPVTIIPVVPEIAGSGLLFATGSDSHLRSLKARAAKLGMDLRDDGLFRGKALLPSDTEEKIYSALGLSFIPPELREGNAELDEAARLFDVKKSFSLVELSDLRGILHVHSTYSDGKNTLLELAEEARRRGFAYLGISDHSQSAAYARGLKAAAIRKQRKEIDALNHELAPFRIFHGIESDILADGSLDYEPEILAELDFVIASVHSRFSLDREAMTKRIIRAVQNPYTTILGHASGRKLLEREGYELDYQAVLQAAAECGVAVEINASPKRLDLRWEYLSLALELGVRIPICPDAHSLAGFDDLRWGIAMARKGGLRPENIPNCSELPDFEKWLRTDRARH